MSHKGTSTLTDLGPRASKKNTRKCIVEQLSAEKDELLYARDKEASKTAPTNHPLIDWFDSTDI